MGDAVRRFQDKKLPADRVFAIHIGGTSAQVQAHLTKYGFTFPALVDADGHLARALDVTATPSVFLVNSQDRIEWASSGLGLSDVWRMENFRRSCPSSPYLDRAIRGSI